MSNMDDNRQEAKECLIGAHVALSHRKGGSLDVPKSSADAAELEIEAALRALENMRSDAHEPVRYPSVLLNKHGFACGGLVAEPYRPITSITITNKEANAWWKGVVADAERYRWLRSKHGTGEPEVAHVVVKRNLEPLGVWCNTTDADELDATIDKAIKQERQPGAGPR